MFIVKICYIPPNLPYPTGSSLPRKGSVPPDDLTHFGTSAAQREKLRKISLIFVT